MFFVLKSFIKMTFRIAYLCRNLLAKNNLLILNKTRSYSAQKIIREGPNLKDFLSSSSAIASDNDIQNDEIITNKLLINSHNFVYDEQNNLKEFVEKQRKVFVEVHGCQMNTNDAEVALAILNKTGLYEKTNSDKEADVILISMLNQNKRFILNFYFPFISSILF